MRTGLLLSDHIHNTYINDTNNYIERRVFNYYQFFLKSFFLFRYTIIICFFVHYCVVYSVVVVVVVVDLSDSSFVVVTGTGGGYHIDNNAVHTILVTNTTFN